MLVSATTWWPLAARLAEALVLNDITLAALSPAGHPLRAVAGVGRHFVYSAWRPVAALAAAIAAVQPELIIPADDRAVRHLHLLHAAAPALRGLIERSLGAPGSFAIAGSRAALLGLAGEERLAVPDHAAIAGAADLDAFAARAPFPWVLKSDGSWGGRGVRVVGDLAAARATFRRMSRPDLLAKAVKYLAVNRDAFPLGEWRHRRTPRISAQAFVAGRPANCLAFCWNGELLANICVEALCTTDPLGAATIVRVIDNAAMTLAARRLVRRLGLSGFCGFDFILEHASGTARLIEMNPRTTQLGHLALGPGRDLVDALCRQVAGRPGRATPAIAADVIALFPGAVRQPPASGELAVAHLDLPRDPALLAELRRTPWEHRSLLSRMSRWWRRKVPRELRRSFLKKSTKKLFPPGFEAA